MIPPAHQPASPRPDAAVSLEPWRLATAALGLAPSTRDRRLAWSGDSAGHALTISADIAAIDSVYVSVTVTSSAIGDHFALTPLALTLTREGRFLTGDIALDRAVVIHGEHPEVAAPWDADTRALVTRLVGELGVVVLAGAIQALPHVTARMTTAEAVGALLDDLLTLATRLASGRGVEERIAAIANDDPEPGVRALYSRVLADVAPTGAFGEARAHAAIDAIDTVGDRHDARETLMRAAKSSPNAPIREQALVKLLHQYPLAEVEPLLLETEDMLGVRVREALIAAMHRAPRPSSALPLLRLMARTPLGPTGLAAAAEALGAVRDPASLTRLAALCQHPEEPIWTVALAALLELDVAPEDLLAALDRGERELVLDRLAEVALARRPRHGAAVLTLLVARWRQLAGASTPQNNARIAAAEAALTALATDPPPAA